MALTQKYPNVKGINLAKNFGQHNAIMAGLNYTEGDLIIGMDDDMQNHPSQIPQFLEKIEEGYDIVSACLNRDSFPGLKISQEPSAVSFCGIFWTGRNIYR